MFLLVVQDMSLPSMLEPFILLDCLDAPGMFLVYVYMQAHWYLVALLR